MKIAYIVDSSTNTKRFKNRDNLFKLPFIAYNENGILEKVQDYKKINKIINESLEGQKYYIEPTPGSYRDLYNQLKKEGYTHIFVIPQTKEKSISFKNAEYASRFSDLNIEVIDVQAFNLSSTELLSHLLEDKSIQENINRIIIDITVLFDLIKTAITNI